MYDWFNNPDVNPYLPYLYDGISNGEQGQIPSTRMYLETPVGASDNTSVAMPHTRPIKSAALSWALVSMRI